MAAADEEPSFGVRLPPGRHGLSRDFVSESQRERLLNGVVDTVVAHGYNATTIAQLIEAAQVSRRTFYELFEGKQDCFLAAYEMIAAHVAEALREAQSRPAWPDRVRGVLEALLGIFAADPTIARFVLVEPLAAGGEVAERHRASLRCFTAQLRPGEPGAEDDALAAAREQALVGGLSTLMVRRLKAGEAGNLEDLLPDLHELVLTSYLGRREAQRIARASAA